MGSFSLHVILLIISCVSDQCKVDTILKSVLVGTKYFAQSAGQKIANQLLLILCKQIQAQIPIILDIKLDVICSYLVAAWDFVSPHLIAFWTTIIDL